MFGLTTGATIWLIVTVYFLGLSGFYKHLYRTRRFPIDHEFLDKTEVTLWSLLWPLAVIRIFFNLIGKGIESIPNLLEKLLISKKDRD